VSILSGTTTYASSTSLFLLTPGEHIEIPCIFQVPFIGGSICKLRLTTSKKGVQEFSEDRYFDIAGSSSGTSSSVLTLSRGAINAGGLAIEEFAADKYVSGGVKYSSDNQVTVEGVLNAAPAEIYQTMRLGDMTYTIPCLNPGDKYILRLHFAEMFFSSAGLRKFNVSVNSIQILNNFDIFTQAGGANKAVVMDFEAAADSTGRISIDFSNVINTASVNGIEWFKATDVTGKLEPFIVNECEVYPVPASNTLHIKFKNNSFQSLAMYDILGKKVLTVPVVPVKGEMKINVSNISSGIYFIVLSAKSGNFMKKVIIERDY